MCGFAGFVDPNGRIARGGDDAERALRAMACSLVHRGPDDDGVAFDAPNGVGLAFRRLAILDLSPAGHQPMESARGRYAIAFNGEVYNHGALREELRVRGHAFRGHSDTETMLAAFEEWGVERAIARFEGMFAFAVLDRTERALWLVRDRFGVKPLFYGLTHAARVPGGSFALPAGAALVFASELKALRACPAWSGSVDRGALTLFVRHGYVPGPLSIHPEARKLRPGHLLRLDLASARVEERCWWHSRDLVRRGAANRFAGGDAEAIQAVDEALLESVRLRMEADVPLGAFLSGGVDSSAVVAAMQAQSPRPVRTFTIGFGPKDLDEAPYARAIAKHLGTEHTEVYVSGDDALATVPRLAEIWDEPFADSSQIPTLLVSEIARRSVTVSLSGDGGDELFGGYYRYAWAQAIASRSQRLPRGARAVIAALLRATPRGIANRTGRALSSVLPSRLSVDRAGDRAHRLAELLSHDDAWSIYLDLVANCPQADALVLGASRPVTALTDPDALVPELDIETRMMQADIASYLVDDILVKVDRASMAVSLEAREPLLDSRLAELAFALPLSMKIRDGERKWVLRRVLERRVPRALFDRPKMGFGVPLAEWLRGPLRPWAEALLAPERLAHEGYLDPAAAQALWARTLDPTRGSSGYDAWNLLMFQAWLERWGGG
ncbi:MAG: asparagine synthase (glutamine-hydrolyzing) [Phycisphaera sp.]|nr:asparagine synthase (glutamine-hydrolyzing) [Phycisphaera sp.]